jgi:hypothetical protein
VDVATQDLTARAAGPGSSFLNIMLHNIRPTSYFIH